MCCLSVSHWPYVDSLCLSVAWLFRSGLSLSLFSVCLSVACLSITGLSVFLWHICLSVAFWSFSVLSVCLSLSPSCLSVYRSVVYLSLNNLSVSQWPVCLSLTLSKWPRFCCWSVSTRPWLNVLVWHSVEKLSGFSAAVLTERCVCGGVFCDSLGVSHRCVNRSDSGPGCSLLRATFVCLQEGCSNNLHSWEDRLESLSSFLWNVICVTLLSTEVKKYYKVVYLIE